MKQLLTSLTVTLFLLVVTFPLLSQNPLLPVTIDPLNSKALEIVEVKDKIILDYLNEDEDVKNFHQYLRSVQTPSQFSMLSNLRIVTLGQNKKPFLLDADWRLPLSVFGFKKFGYHSFQIIPWFKFRIFQDDKNAHYGIGDFSRPVRTPSAMPGVAWYWTLPSWWQKKPSADFFKHKYIGIYAFHHSNGQDGPTIIRGNGGLIINQYNGDFSQDIVFEFIVGGRRIGREMPFTTGRNTLVPKLQKGTMGFEYERVVSKYTEFNWRVGYEYHPSSLTLSILNRLNIYGRNRCNLYLTWSHKRKLAKYISNEEQWYQFEQEKSYERWRHSLNVSYIADKNYARGELTNKTQDMEWFRFDRRLNFDYSLYFIPKNWQSLAFFTQVGYFGSDYYNIYFNDSYLGVRVGLAFAFFEK